MTSSRIDKLLRLLEIEPDDAFCLYALAQEYAKVGRHDEALRHFNRVVAIEPGHGYAYYHKARSLAAMGRVDEARAVLMQGLQAVDSAADPKAARELSEYFQALAR